MSNMEPRLRDGYSTIIDDDLAACVHLLFATILDALWIIEEVALILAM
jgi:hypothetical protein